MQQYLDLLQTVKDKGTYKPAAREGMPGTLSLFGYQFRHDLSKGFPLLTTKKLSLKNIVVELLSFLRGDETIEFLQENNCKIWDEDVEKFDPVDKIHWGKQYPYLWRNWGGNLRYKKRDKSKFKLEEPINTILETEELETYKTLSYGEFKVIKRYKDENSHNMCMIQFLETGYITNIRESRLTGDIYDPYAPSYCGVACLGVFEEDEIAIKLKTIWKGIIQRCYDENKDNYKYYGGSGVKVSNRWKCFRNFNEDVRLLINWESKLNDWGNYELDKDLKGGSEYSIDNCIWISQKDNKRQKVLGKIYTVYNNETGVTEKFEISQDIIKKYNLHQGNFNAMLRGERSSASGWKLVNSVDKYGKGTDQIKNLIEGLKNNPESRRHIITAWNPETLEDMALNACFTEDNFVSTNAGYKSIKDVEVNDFVITKEGKFERVYDKFINEFNGTLIGLEVSGISEEIKCTPNHKFLTMNGEWKEALFLTELDYVCIPINKDSIIDSQPSSYKTNQFTSIDLNIDINNEDLWWVFGFFLGDGWRLKSRGRHEIAFSINLVEEELVLENIRKIFPTINCTRKSDLVKTKGCRTWVVSKKEFSKVFDSFGSGAKNKIIPQWVLEAPRNLILKFLEGYRQADGTKTKELYQVTTISPSIAYGIQLLLLKVGKQSSVNRTERRAFTIIEGRTVRQNKWLYQVNEIEGAKFDNQLSNEYEFKKIKKIHRYPDIKTTVYNLSVENSHTYTIQNCIVSNCHALVQFNCRPLTWEDKLQWAMRQPNVEMENLAITEAAAGKDCPQYYLDCQMYQRSADVFLGVPYNIASYALMTHIFAKITNMIPGEFIHTFGDVHIYDNHKEQVDLQLTRAPKELPTIKIVDEGNDWAAISNLNFDLIEFLGPEDFIIEGYNPHPSIKGKLSTGLK